MRDERWKRRSEKPRVRWETRDEGVREGRREMRRGPKRGGSYLPAGLRGASRRALLAPAEDNFRAGALEEREGGGGVGCGRAGRASSHLQKAGRRDARRKQGRQADIVQADETRDGALATKMEGKRQGEEGSRAKAGPVIDRLKRDE